MFKIIAITLLVVSQIWAMPASSEEKFDYEVAEDDIKGGAKEMSEDDASSEEVGLITKYNGCVVFRDNKGIHT